jgi:excisionase family DNA binding protein
MDRAEPSFLGIGEVAQKLGYSTSNIRRLDRAGELRAAAVVSGRRIFHREDVERFQAQLEKRRASKAAA